MLVLWLNYQAIAQKQLKSSTQHVAAWRNSLPGDIGVPKGMNRVKKESDTLVQGVSSMPINYSHSYVTSSSLTQQNAD